MTNEELYKVAYIKGYWATIDNGGVYIKPSPMRPARLFSLEAVAENMDLPEELFIGADGSVLIHGVDA